MTTIPVHLPGLIKEVLEADAAITVDSLHREGRNWFLMRVIWADRSITMHDWRLGIDGVWSHQGPGRIQETRARAEREAQS